LRLFAGLSEQPWSAEVAAQYVFASGLQRSDAGFSSQLMGATLAPCWNAHPIGLCAVGAISYFQVNGRGVDNARTSAGLVWACGARTTLSQRFGSRFSVALRGDAWLPLTRQSVLLNREEVFTTASISGSAGLDFSVLFR
jgi:hypothetical protein